MQICKLNQNQHESMIDLLAEIHAYYADGATVSRGDIHEHLLENLLSPKSPHELIVYCSDDGAVLGFAAITMVFSLFEFAPNKRKQCQLKELYVRSSFTGKGIGRALMSWVAAYALENECHRMDWLVKATNTEGISFYKSIGAMPVQDKISFRLSELAMGVLASKHRSASDA